MSLTVGEALKMCTLDRRLGQLIEPVELLRVLFFSNLKISKQIFYKMTFYKREELQKRALLVKGKNAMGHWLTFNFGVNLFLTHYPPSFISAGRDQQFISIKNLAELFQ